MEVPRLVDTLEAVAEPAAEAEAEVVADFLDFFTLAVAVFGFMTTDCDCIYRWIIYKYTLSNNTLRNGYAQGE
jgi:hypothetical protein